MLRGLLRVGLSIRLRQTLAALQGHGDVLTTHKELEQALTTLGIQVEPAPARPAPLCQPTRSRKRWWRRAA